MIDRPPVRVAAVQTAPRFGDVAANLARAGELVRAHPADLYVLPELFSTGYLFAGREEIAQFAEPYPTGSAAAFLTELSAETGAVLVGGFPERAPDGRLFNSAAIADRGVPRACYRKIHLFDSEWDWFDPGDCPPAVIETSAGRLGPMICFDWIFPETARCLALGGAQILAHSANLVMPYCQDAMVTRCLENRVFAVTANRVGSDERGGQALTFTGNSQITGRGGGCLAQATTDREEVLVAEIDPAEADDWRINPNNDLRADRRPGFYGHLTT